MRARYKDFKIWLKKLVTVKLLQLITNDQAEPATMNTIRGTCSDGIKRSDYVEGITRPLPTLIERRLKNTADSII